MEKYFIKEAKKTIKDIKENYENGDICFALLTDSHLTDTGDITRENISYVDEAVGFDFVAHLGGITNGNNPKNITIQLLKSEFSKYENSIKNKRLFVVPGEKDGWRDERYTGQLALNMMTDEVWYKATAYLQKYPFIQRIKNKPYFYADIPDKNTRLIFMSSYFTQIDEKSELFQKNRMFEISELSWLKNEALNLKEGSTALIFSNALPMTKYETGNAPFVYNGYSTEQTIAIVQQAKNRGINVGGWFSGYYNCDAEDKTADINFILTASLSPNLESYSKSKDVRKITDRKKEKNQDLWDAVLVKPNEKRIYIYRFGTGKDRVIEY